MLELPETLNIAKQFNSSVVGAAVESVLPPVKPHKFCWFSGDAASYDNELRGANVVEAYGFGSFAELRFSNGKRLCINDGVNARLYSGDLPDNYQLAVRLTGGSSLVFSVAMYGGIYLHSGEFANEYYEKSRTGITPLMDNFGEYFSAALSKCKQTLSVKGFVATEQRFVGVGNGVLQDILFNAGLSPKRKLSALSDDNLQTLFDSMKSTLYEMTESGGRDTEKDLYGKEGGYKTIMSKNALDMGCPICGGAVTKEAYMGGSVYYCPHCQK